MSKNRKGTSHRVASEEEKVLKNSNASTTAEKLVGFTGHMRTKLLYKKYSEESQGIAFAFDLGEDAYFNSQFIAAIELNIEGMRKEESLRALFAHRETIYRCKSAKEAISVADTRR